MNKTKLQTQGLAVSVDGTLKYRLEWFCADAGELPDTSIFLYKVTNLADETSDTFVRVVYPGDFDNYPKDRLQASTNAENYYRSVYLFRVYDDVQVAAAARRALDDSVNNLVADYIVYKTQIASGLQNIEFPSTTPDYITELKEAYLAAYAEVLTANADYADAQNDYSKAKDAYASAAANYSTWSALASQASAHYNTLSSFVALINSSIAGLQDKSGHEGTLASITTALPGAQAAVSGLLGVVNNIALQANAARVLSETAAQEVSTTRQAVYETYATAQAKWDAADVKLSAFESANYDPSWAATQRTLLNSQKPVAPSFD